MCIILVHKAKEVPRGAENLARSRSKCMTEAVCDSPLGAAGGDGGFWGGKR